MSRHAFSRLWFLCLLAIFVAGSLPRTSAADSPATPTLLGNAGDSVGQQQFDNNTFELPSTPLNPTTYPANSDFAAPQTLPAAAYPANYAFTQGLTGWTASNVANTQSVNDNNGLSQGNPYLLMSGSEQWVLSSAFVVTDAAQSLNFDYATVNNEGAIKAGAIDVAALTGSNFDAVSNLGSVSASALQGWQRGVLDLQAFRGQTIKLRFRTTWFTSQARLDNIALHTEVPGWQPSNSQFVRVAGGMSQAVSEASVPDNITFEDGRGALLGAAQLPNKDFSTGQTTVPPTNFTFTDATLQGWTTSDGGYASVANDDPGSPNGSHLVINGGEKWASTPAFAVTDTVQSVRFDYALRSQYEGEFGAVDIDVLSGPTFQIATPLGRVTSTAVQGWQRNVALDLQAFQSQTIKLRFRTAWFNATARIDTIRLSVEVPQWTPSDARLVQITNNDPMAPGNQHLFLNGSNQWVLSSAFVVSDTVPSVRFDYAVFKPDAETETRQVNVFALSGDNFQIVTQLGSVYGSGTQG